MAETTSIETQLDLDPEQKLAVELCCDKSNRVVAVTGPAGSGKTFIMKTVYETLVKAGYSVALAAPTGKAAKRVQESTGIPAQTIHRLLEYTHPGDPDPKTGVSCGHSYPRRDTKNPLEFDIILADEYAMVNQEVHRNLFDALKPGAGVRCFGDINQLDPIEETEAARKEDSPFKKLLSGKFPSVTLQRNHRQSAGSGIAEQASRILMGRMPIKKEDFRITITDKPVDTIQDLVMSYMEDGVDFRTLDNQIISPQNKKSWVGSTQLNGTLQSVFWDSTKGNGINLPRHPWADKNIVRVQVGTKVIYTFNTYELELFNGETGIVTEISEYGEVVVDFGDREVAIPPVLVVSTAKGTAEIDPRKNLELAYVLTTHKTQGSEYKNVIYILNKSTAYMQSRRNFYTAVTRARQMAHLITDQASLARSVNNRG